MKEIKLIKLKEQDWDNFETLGGKECEKNTFTYGSGIDMTAEFHKMARDLAAMYYGER